jgi:hypothetical protein
MANAPGTIARQLLRSVLLADAALRVRTAGNVLTTHVSSAEAGTILQEKPCVILDVDGGFTRYFGVLQDTEFQLWCWSKASSDEANDLYDAVFSLLQQVRLTATDVDLIGSARETKRSSDGFIDELRAWYAHGRWTLKAL